MKKLGALLCVILIALSLSACTAFHDDTTQNYAQNNPLETTVFLQVKNVFADPATELTNWLKDVRTENNAITDPTATKIVTIEQRDESAIKDTYTIDLTIQNAPVTTLHKQVRPFKITYTQTIFNPITLLPDSNVFQYIVAYSTQRRHSATNTEHEVTIDEDGNYIYFWTTDADIKFIDDYPNRPLYYVIILGGATIIGIAIYFISRYYDCKKRQKPL